MTFVIDSLGCDFVTLQKTCQSLQYVPSHHLFFHKMNNLCILFAKNKKHDFVTPIRKKSYKMSMGFYLWPQIKTFAVQVIGAANNSISGANRIHRRQKTDKISLSTANVDPHVNITP